jgi:hypothetical protein
MTGHFPRARVWVAAAALGVLAVTLSSCYVAPYPYRGVAVVGPPVVVVGPHRCWRCW